MSEKSKDCGNHGSDRRFYRRLFAFFLSLIILILIIILIIWLVLRPSKPSFQLQSLSLQQLNISTPLNLIFIIAQITVTSRNPNDRIGVYYDKLDAYVEYKGQQITAATLLPNGYQGHHDVIVWSPYLVGAAVPVAQYVADELSQDKFAGYLLLYVKVEGKLRWKVGVWVSGHYHLQVRCPAFLSVDGADNTTFKFARTASCTVDI